MLRCFKGKEEYPLTPFEDENQDRWFDRPALHLVDLQDKDNHRTVEFPTTLDLEELNEDTSIFLQGFPHGETYSAALGETAMVLAVHGVGESSSKVHIYDIGCKKRIREDSDDDENSSSKKQKC